MRTDHGRALLRLTAVTAGAGFTALAYGGLIERRWFHLRRVELAGLLRPGLPRPARASADRPLRLLHVSDLHLTPPARPLARFLRGLAALDVDLVVATGDMLGAQGSEDVVVELLAGLTADGTPGVAVLGSNDLFGPAIKSPHHYFLDPGVRIHGPPLDAKRYCAGLAEAGWHVLEDRRVTVATARGLVEVAGLRDPHLRDVRLPERSLVEARARDTVLRLGLVHAPYRRALDLLTDVGYELILAGHTHGGQIRVPMVGALVTNCDLPPRQARGTSRWSSDRRASWLHVSAGLGESRYAPVRFACRPEVSVLELLP